jgi:hypothetical protein
MRGRTRVLVGVVVAALLPLVPAHALNSAHGGIVATDPVAWTPEILDGEVMALVP